MALDRTRPVQTRNGNPAKILAEVRLNAGRRLVVTFTLPDGVDVVDTRLLNGQISDAAQADLDIVNVPNTWYIVVWRDKTAPNAYLVTTPSTLQAARDFARTQRETNPNFDLIARVKFMEGQRDD